MNYLDFEIEISSGSGDEYLIAVIRSPAGEVKERIRFPFSELQLENRLLDLELALLRTSGKRRRVLSEEEQAVQRFGRELFDFLLPNEVRSLYRASLSQAIGQDCGLRIKLRLTGVPELAALPWEFLYDQNNAEYLCLSHDTPIVRYIDVPRPPTPLQITPPLRILGMIASPKDLPELDVAREKERVERALANLQAEGLVKLTWLEGQTWRDLQRALRQGQWHIFHFIGHGGFNHQRDEGFVAFCDMQGQERSFTASELARLLANQRSLRLILLNACKGGHGSQHDIFSSTAAILVRRGIPAVLAMQYEITDRAAIELARSFYEALADGLPVDAAVTDARQSISFAAPYSVEWVTPVLYMRSPDGKLFDVQVMGNVQPVAGPEGDEVEVGISKVEPERNQIMVSMIEPLAVDWNDLKVGQVYTGRITRLENFGAFVDIGAEREGLVHVSELSHDYIKHPSEAFKVGDKVDVQVLGFNRRKRRIALSIKALQQKAEPEVQVVVKDDGRVTAAGIDEEEFDMPTAMELAMREVMGNDAIYSLMHGRRGQKGSKKERRREPSQNPVKVAAPKPKSEKQSLLNSFIHEKTGFEFVRIPAGEFLYGDHKKTITLPEYWISKTPVTQAVYRQFIAANPKQSVPNDWNKQKRTFPDGKAEHPVIYVNWYDAVAFCKWAGLELPTEEQWEKAARSTDGKKYPWGNNEPTDKLCNFNKNVGGTTPVGQYSPQGDSLYGCVDMSGNAWEWCLNKYKTPEVTTIDQSSDGRVLRGGSWLDYASRVRSAVRDLNHPGLHSPSDGFRVVVARRPASK